MTAPATPDDDLLHTAGNDDPSWTETFWFPFYLPEPGISCYVYAFIRPNLGLAGGGVIVWDGGSDLLWEAPYARYDWSEPFHNQMDADTTFPSGVRLKTVEALQRYQISYEDGDLIALSVDIEGRHQPHVPGRRGDQQGMRGHYDQACRVTGELRLHGVGHQVDSYPVRDRSWGPRSDSRSRWWGRHVAYTTGGALEGAFLAHFVEGNGPIDKLFDGFVIWEGREARLEGGTRSVERANGRPVRVQASFYDDLGRQFGLEGTRLNRLCFQPYPSMLCGVTTMSWRLNGTPFIGEDQDVWAPHAYRQLVRAPWPGGK
jgi:hypothetical protein